MKRALLSTFLVVALVGTAQAQSGLPGNAGNIQGVFSASATIDVLTTVIQRLQVEGTQALDFGYVTAPASGSTSYDELQPGAFTITGQSGATVSLNTGTVSTTLSGGTGTVTFSADPLSSASATLTSGTATVEITGSISVSDDASGDFSGTYELEVAYTGV